MEKQIIPLKKIVVIGPESTGKSTLCQQLSDHYNASWCPEYARNYLLENGKDYTFNTLLTIAKGQIALEDSFTKNIRLPENSRSPQLLFIDTDMYVLKVWCEFVFNNCHQWILDQIVTRKYDLYLLCNTDLPWVKDELREYPDHDTRNRLYNIYEDIMINQQVPWVDIRGNSEERLSRAISSIDRILYPLL